MYSFKFKYVCAVQLIMHNNHLSLLNENNMYVQIYVTFSVS